MHLQGAVPTTNTPWQVRYGFWSSIDAEYRSFVVPSKPRLPCSEDTLEAWKHRCRPQTIDSLLGNPKTTTMLQTLVSESVSTPVNYIITGDVFTGKTSVLQLLQQILAPDTEDSVITFEKIDAIELSEKRLLNILKNSSEVAIAVKKKRYIVIENFGSIPVSVQQRGVLPIILNANRHEVFFICIDNPDATKIIDQMKSIAVSVHLQPLKTDHVRRKLLSICTQELIGYTQDGLEAIVQECKGNLRAAMKLLLKVFKTQSFISIPNVLKALLPSDKPIQETDPVPFSLSILEMNKPLRRCRKCTLKPPCSHISLQDLYKRVVDVRSKYANNENTLPVCTSFQRAGMCKSMERLGRCRWNHPLDLHDIDTTGLVDRCQVHTLPRPCMHCQNINESKQKLGFWTSRIRTLQHEILQAREELAEADKTKYFFVREQSKVRIWGEAKRIYLERLEEMDSRIRKLHADIHSAQKHLHEAEEKQAEYKDKATRGYSKGKRNQVTHTA